MTLDEVVGFSSSVSIFCRGTKLAVAEHILPSDVTKKFRSWTGHTFTIPVYLKRILRYKTSHQTIAIGNKGDQYYLIINFNITYILKNNYNE